jgi:hypothetical protein
MGNRIIKHGIVLSYREVFDDYDQAGFPTLISGIFTQTVLRVISYYSGKVYYQGYDPKLHIEALEHWGQRFPTELKSKLNQLARQQLQKTGKFLQIRA